MESIKSTEGLRIAIAELEAQVLFEKKELLSITHNTMESLNPLSSIKNAFTNLKSSVSEKDNLLNTIIGLGGGLILKKILPRKPVGFIKNIASILLQLGFTHRISKDQEAIKNLNQEILDGVDDNV